MFLIVFLSIEVVFLIANLYKFVNGGWFTIALSSLFFFTMYGWFFGRKLKNSLITFVNLTKFRNIFGDLHKDTSVPLFAANLVYLTKANRVDQVESKIMYSIFHKQPKRAATYWLLHIDIQDEPNTFEYRVHHLIEGVLIKVDFKLGFKIEPRINLYFHEIIEDLANKGEIEISSPYLSLRKNGIPADFRFVNLDRVMSRDFQLSPHKSFIIGLHKFGRFIGINDAKAFGLDSSNELEEKIPIIFERPIPTRIKRIN